MYTETIVTDYFLPSPFLGVLALFPNAVTASSPFNFLEPAAHSNALPPAPFFVAGVAVIGVLWMSAYLHRLRGLFLSCISQFAQSSGAGSLESSSNPSPRSNPSGEGSPPTEAASLSTPPPSDNDCRGAFESIRQPLLVCDALTLQVLAANGAAARFFERSQNEILRCKITDLLAPHESQLVLAFLATTPVPLPPRMAWSRCSRDGTTVHAEITADYLQFQGREARLVQISDVSEHRRLEQRLIEEKTATEQTQNRLAELKFALDQHAIVAITDTHGRITYANDKFCEISGYSRDELLGRTHRIVNSGYHPTEFFAELYRTITRGEVWRGQIRNRAKNGSCYWVQTTIVPFRNARGEPWQYTAIRTDITHFKSVLEDLARKDAALLNAQRIGRIGSWELELHTGELHWSPEIYRVFGREMDRFRPSREAFQESVHASDRERVANALESAIRNAQPYRVEHRIVRPDGATRWVYQEGELVSGPSGEIQAVRGILQDMTDRRNLEEQLRQSQKMDAIGHLAGGVAHDFNNLLTVIRGQTELVLADGGLTKGADELLRQVIEAAERGSHLTRQLLSFSRKEFLQPESLDLSEVVNDLLKMLRRIIGEPYEVRADLAPNLPPIRADRGMLEQVLMNLAVNARDAMPRGGQVAIRTDLISVQHDRPSRFARGTPGEFVRLTVADTGCGIPTELIPRIFEPFFTTKSPGRGTGLGLATVHGIVEQHEGWIDVESTIDVGTAFHLHFPARPELVSRHAASLAGVVPRGGTESILLVEDASDVRFFVHLILERLGYRVLQAASGDEALTAWQEHRNSIDLLLTDVVMPSPISGTELAARLQAEQPNLPIIFISGYSQDSEQHEPTTQPGVRFLQKPFTPQKLAAVVRESLDGQMDLVEIPTQSGPQPG